MEDAAPEKKTKKDKKQNREQIADLDPDKGAAEEVEEGAAAGEASGDDVSHLRIPREVDNASLLQTLAIKDALIKQMEAVMLLPPPEHSVTVGLGRKAQALVANARRREAVLACKLKALNGEVHAMRKRELQAARINRGLRRKLCDTLADVDAVALRREVRTLRADLSAALTREAALERELRIANHAMASANAPRQPAPRAPRAAHARVVRRARTKFMRPPRGAPSRRSVAVLRGGRGECECCCCRQQPPAEPAPLLWQGSV